MPEEMRTFVAILISEGLRQKIASVQDELIKAAPAVKWVAQDNFHITVKFLGGVESSRIDTVIKAIAEAVEEIKPFEIEIGGVGAFPSPNRPKTVWVGVTKESGMLAEVAKLVEDALEKLGFERENRPFRSHITVGRVKDDRDARELGPAIKNAEAEQLGPLMVNSVAVMKSDLRREGPVYSALKEIFLKKPEGE